MLASFSLFAMRTASSHISAFVAARFLAGEVLGSINQMNHVHLNYAPEGLVRNPLELGFIGVKDHIPPLIEKIYVADKFGQRLGLQRAEIISKGEGKGRKKKCVKSSSATQNQSSFPVA